jgi:ribosome-associated toxin RatA of RatAB toxin-antitoxin module
MRTIHLHAAVATDDPDAAFALVADFTRYPELADDVHIVRTHPATTPAHPRNSDWEVNFRRGIMRWNEEEVVDFAALRIDFHQTDGDFEEFRGAWLLVPTDGGAEIRFEVTYDFGIESLVGIMDPIAERVIKRAVCAVLGGLFGEITISRGGAALSDLGDLADLPGLTMSIGGI